MKFSITPIGTDTGDVAICEGIADHPFGKKGTVS